MKITDKFSAYTIIEITVVMLLSAISMSICYMGYSVVNEYFKAFQEKNHLVQEFLILNQTLQSDLDKSVAVRQYEKGIQLKMDSGTIHYQFLDSMSIRTLNFLKRDTFLVEVDSLYYGFKGLPSIEDGLIDEFKAQAIVGSELHCPMIHQKWYSASTLINSKKDEIK